ncbi:alpha-amylase [Mycoplasmopsis pullorum]|uniref:alpha-amylase family glycosyl hydrolase n=1 Tax=Mycoplasmopsis pullorum TaxID=48003 RepID=UPI001118B702|nr:alpha-amylase family glycosyl hydrolase [Mycoplasmopsis pullorum]TNK83669.1 alpha-amylase [Mycoplasmopsis pullorum]TNK92148.1 alpha-amylase [Mycoplasmopsis pullorum]
MNLIGKNDDFFKEFDEIHFYEKDDLGVHFVNEKLVIKLWQPIAKKAEILIYPDYENEDNFEVFEMNFNKPVWSIELPKKYLNYYYRYRITHQDSTVTLALDPYCISLAPFNWKGKENKVALGAILPFEIEKLPKIKKLETTLNNGVDPLVYELNIRDFAPAGDGLSSTFSTLADNKVFEYLKELNFTHVQFLPIQSTYTIDDLGTRFIPKGEAQGWVTNYNWGYDPHNYFSINGFYSTNPKNPQGRINEFANLVDSAHKSGIGVILDVVYNHMMTNSIMDNIIPGYYFRDNAKVTPVNLPPLASQRKMVRKLIIDSLKYFAKTFDVDGFRFDLSCFIDEETLAEIARELRKIKPNIVLHGEAWPFSDLPFEKSWIKGTKGNDYKFAYFNDTIRDAIGVNENDSTQKGLIIEHNQNQFLRYVTSVTGNIKNYDWNDIPHSNSEYDVFANDINITLSYNACHDGLTLWDKIITQGKEWSFERCIEAYRQALILTTATQGRKLYLAGTELAQTKPLDISGEEVHRGHKIVSHDFFNLKPDYDMVQSNSYKTSDYTNELKWNNLKNPMIKELIFEFIKQLNEFRNSTPFFRLDTNEKINDSVKFKLVDIEQGILIFNVSDIAGEVLVAHNFSDNDFKYNFNNYKVLFNSKINPIDSREILESHSSLILLKEHSDENN